MRQTHALFFYDYATPSKERLRVLCIMGNLTSDRSRRVSPKLYLCYKNLTKCGCNLNTWKRGRGNGEEGFIPEAWPPQEELEGLKVCRTSPTSP